MKNNILVAIFSICVFSLINEFAFAQNTDIDSERLYFDLLNHTPQTGSKTILLEDSTLCHYNVDNGLLNGPFVSYYSNGKVKAKGQFKNNKMVGKWKISASYGNRFLILDYEDKEMYEMKRVRTGFLRNPVKWGNGKVDYSGFGTSMIETSRAYQGKVRYKKGIKHGEVKEYYLDGKLRRELNFVNGLYEGKYIYMPKSGHKYVAEYKNGLPVGIWEYYDNQGVKLNFTDYVSEPYVQRIPNRLYVTESEVIFSSRTKMVIHSAFERNNELFLPDSNGVSLFSILQHAFVFDETSFYVDEDLTTLKQSSPTYQNITGLNLIQESKCEPVMLILYDFPYFTNQLSDLRNMLLQIILVVKYTDEKQNEHFINLPFIYFPETYTDLKQKKIHSGTLEDIFIKLLQYHYYSVTFYVSNVRNTNLYDGFEDNSWIDEGIVQQFTHFNMTHDLWMYQTGVLK